MGNKIDTICEPNIDSVDPLCALELLTFGYVNVFEQRHELSNPIPLDIKSLITKYHPLCSYLEFDLYNKKNFITSENDTIIEGKNDIIMETDNMKYMIFLKDKQYLNGYSNGIHYFSVQNHNGCESIGIISSSKYKKYHIQKPLKMEYWLYDSYNSWQQLMCYHGKWAVNEIRTVELNFNVNKIKFFKGLKEIKSVEICPTIHTNRKNIDTTAYYFAICMTANIDTKAQIIHTPIQFQYE
eukprot:145691_1